MSIAIDNIYCNHFLKNKKLQDFCKNPKFESFIYPSHPILTSFHVKDTIHYNALIKNDYKNYEEFIKTTNQKEHSVNNFLKLKENFDIKKMEKIKIIYNFGKNKYFIEDGVHRFSLLLFNNIITDNIPIKYLDIKNNNCFFFVIYEHGINKIDNICEEIEKTQIRIDKKINIDLPHNKFQEFIINIYPDINKRHILSKNNYIIQKSKKKDHVKAIILLVSISKWNFMINKHNSVINKCKEIELFKRHIRNLYNPKLDDINKPSGPLNNGVSHNHIIHSIDLPNEFTLIYHILDKYSKYIQND